MDVWQAIEQHIEQVTGDAFKILQTSSVGGGSINSAYSINDVERKFFVKTNHVQFADMFAAEAESLQELTQSQTLRVPEPVCYGEHTNQCYIVMEQLELNGRADMALFGQQLAAMHKVTTARFGWSIDNTIGSTHQPNSQENDWVIFWQKHRLGFQLELAASKGYGGELLKMGERLLADCPALFQSYQPEASMLHGDLWSGNYGALAEGVPVIFDPALYYGDRETDLAMTTLFGGFGNDFYAAYNEVWPLDVGYAVRKTFYNIYHIINHLNLFGGGYEGQAINMIDQVLSEL